MLGLVIAGLIAGLILGPFSYVLVSASAVIFSVFAVTLLSPSPR